MNIQLNLSPQEAADIEALRYSAAKVIGVSCSSIDNLRIIKRSVDARKRDIRIILSVEVSVEGAEGGFSIKPFNIQDVSKCPEVIIVGAGPAGLFAALTLIERGFRPIILERGKDISARKIDIAKIYRESTINPDSNYCFGEGGAGTFSDGKLFTRSKKRGDNSRVLELLYLHGASENILYEAHPHIGSDRLPNIISAISSTIREAGGEILFNSCVNDILIRSNRAEGVATATDRYKGIAVLLATGNSSRDIYNLCSRYNIPVEFKPFAVGVRVEHRQEHIDRLMYHGKSRGKYLPPAAYSLVRQVENRGVYSFCMCPGGFVVPSATFSDEVVVNGMSPSHHNSPFANSGIVVEIRREDLRNLSCDSEYIGIEFQQLMEKRAWEEGKSAQIVPTQRLTDFVAGDYSSSLPKVSYLAETIASPLHEWLPKGVGNRLQEGFRLFDKQLHGFITGEAVVMGVETRTSSPLRILRNSETMQSIAIEGLYPCGEGAGYAGGIVSSAIDGMVAAEKIKIG